MPFPAQRLRRLRRTENLRRLVRETRLSTDDLVLPLFACPGRGVRQPVASMPGVFRTSVDEIAKDAEKAAKAGLPAVIIFGIPDKKDAQGSEAWAPEGVSQRAIRAVKKAAPDLVVIADTCFCEYTDHGHCGPLKDGRVDNDAALAGLGLTAAAQAEAGADIIAPSGMMDGMVTAIRQALDKAGRAETAILSYAAKYASGFYGPFREAADCAPKSGDRRGYQMDPANGDEALREVRLDVDEGADMVMVKPALPYLDIVRRVKTEFGLPTAAYCVSGEYAMIEAAAAKGWLERERVVMETLTCIRRAGADFILTYWAIEAAGWMK
jgi:porphobilinogen synthase